MKDQTQGDRLWSTTSKPDIVRSGYINDIIMITEKNSRRTKCGEGFRHPFLNSRMFKLKDTKSACFSLYCVLADSPCNVCWGEPCWAAVDQQAKGCRRNRLKLSRTHMAYSKWASAIAQENTHTGVVPNLYHLNLQFNDLIVTFI